MDSFRKLYPEEFYSRFLEQNVRPDGRALSEVRGCTVTGGSQAMGSALVRMGSTAVVCGVRGELGAPPAATSDRNQLIVNVEVTSVSCASAHLEDSRVNTDAKVCESRLHRLLSSLVLVDTRCLLAAPDLLWYLYFDVYILAHDGNIFDACLLACGGALRCVRLPAIVLKNNQPYVDPEAPKHQLSLMHSCYSLSFAVFRNFVIVDPTMEEEQLAEATFSIIHTDEGHLVDIYKAHGKGVSMDMLEKCTELALKRSKELHVLF